MSGHQGDPVAFFLSPVNRESHELIFRRETVLAFLETTPLGQGVESCLCVGEHGLGFP